MTASKVGVEVLRSLEPIRAFSQERLEELSQLRMVEPMARNEDPFRECGKAGMWIGAINIPLSEIRNAFDVLDKHREYVLYWPERAAKLGRGFSAGTARLPVLSAVRRLVEQPAARVNKQDSACPAQA